MSNFSSKISVCYAFCLISKEIFDDMNAIRKLRNESAHSYNKIDFLDKEIEGRIFGLNCCRKISKEWNVK
ncbi:MAG: MltR family transcriptional regulator [Proteobacteria bacterium]|nr:MltR family transcriptional regulator [Pseudomonadota bacterium]MBU1594351.1 MltR family transcriptional regulator [Pseudomonadota bacterium]